MSGHQVDKRLQWLLRQRGAHVQLMTPPLLPMVQSPDPRRSVSAPTHKPEQGGGRSTMVRAASCHIVQPSIFSQSVIFLPPHQNISDSVLLPSSLPSSPSFHHSFQLSTSPALLPCKYAFSLSLSLPLVHPLLSQPSASIQVSLPSPLHILPHKTCWPVSLSPSLFLSHSLHSRALPASSPCLPFCLSALNK